MPRRSRKSVRIRLTGSPAEDEIVEIRYTLTLEDYAEGNYLLLMNTTFWRKFNYNVFVRYGLWIGVPGLCLAISAFLLNLFEPNHRTGGAVAGALGAAAWVFAIGIISPYTYKRKIARFFREQKLPSERTFTAQDSGVLIVRTDGTAESRLSWSAFDKTVESERAFVFVPNLRQFICIPKRAMTAAQADELRALIAANVGQPAAVAGR